MKFKFERKKSITLSNNYVPINDPPQTLEVALSVFVGEVNNMQPLGQGYNLL